MQKIVGRSVLDPQTNERFDLEELFNYSRNLVLHRHPLTVFFNNNAKGRVLDVLIGASYAVKRNGFTGYIFTNDIVDLAEISRASFSLVIKPLTELGIVYELYTGQQKFYRINTKNKMAKHLIEFYNMLLVENVDKKYQK